MRLTLTRGDGKSGVGGALLLASWLVGSGALMAFEFEGSRFLAALVFLVACTLWFVGYGLVIERSKFLRVFSYVLLAYWLGGLGFVAVLGSLTGDAGWLCVADLSMVAAALVASHYRFRRRPTATFQGGTTGPPRNA